MREPVFTETMQIGIVVRDLDATRAAAAMVGNVMWEESWTFNRPQRGSGSRHDYD